MRWLFQAIPKDLSDMNRKERFIKWLAGIIGVKIIFPVPIRTIPTQKYEIVKINGIYELDRRDYEAVHLGMRSPERFKQLALQALLDDLKSYPELFEVREFKTFGSYKIEYQLEIVKPNSDQS